MRAARFTATLFAAVALATTAAAANAADTTRDAGTTKSSAQPAADKADATPSAPKPAPKPACRACGGTCGLQPICVCEPGTRKKSTTTYSMKCEPVCVPAPCLLPGWNPLRRPLSCTDSGCDGACAGATIRTKKSLLKTVREEEVDIVTRKIEYLCRHCSGSGPAANCRSCAAPAAATPRPPWWWPWPSFP
jgi:hypothetical protein